ncbi:MAG TPA: hypothetical protein VKQ72_11515 [Aggregatilineales bacterium]|nr:hypothetical protein [Aggregatilineales bacterium]
MIRFVLLTVGLFLIFLVAGIGAQVYASTQPAIETLTSANLALCGGKLCFDGITPGVSGTQEARAIFGQGEGSNYYLTTDSFVGSAISFGPTVMEVTVRPKPGTNLVNAGQMVRLLGLPMTVIAGSTYDTIILQYTGVSIEVAATDGQLSPHSPVRSVDMFAVSAAMDVPYVGDSEAAPPEVAWKGFASWSLYHRIGLGLD